MRNNEYIDIHVLETVPPSCVNRDESGSPKIATYGGTLRARVSSQCWKKAIRDMLRDLLPENLLGYRTMRLHELLTDAIQKKNPKGNADERAKVAIETAGVKLTDKKDKNTKEERKETGALFFISPHQLEALAELAATSAKLDKEECQKRLKEKPAVDVALFGRMVATKDSTTSLNHDAAAQVAHAISTHTVHNEYDYFTAVDDCAPEDNAGAGHLGTVEYNSATLYRYATVNVRELRGHLGERTPEAVRAFVEAFVRSMPKGKINTFANNVLPNAVYVTFRRDQPINLVGAFEQPVQAKNGGYVQPSVAALVQHAKATYADYLGQPEAAMAVGAGMEELCARMTLPQLLEQVERLVRENGGQA